MPNSAYGIVQVGTYNISITRLSLSDCRHDRDDRNRDDIILYLMMLQSAVAPHPRSMRYLQ